MPDARRRPGDAREPRRPAPGRASNRAADRPGAHRSPSWPRSRAAMLAAGAAALLAVGVPVATTLAAPDPVGHVVGDAPLTTSWPSAPEPGLDTPEDVLVSPSLTPGAPIRSATPSASPTRRRTATPTRTPSRSPATRAVTPLSFEAESSVNALTGGRVQAVTGASGGLVVTGLGGGNTLTVRVSVSAAGIRRLTVHYLAPQTRAANLTLNGAFVGSTTFPGTGGRLGSLTVPVSLVAGVNRIGFANPGGRAPDIDRLTAPN